MTRASLVHVVIAAFALPLAGCGSGAEQPANAATTRPDDYARQMRALPKGQRDGVLLRAVRDAGRDCQQVTASQGIAEVAGAPAWAATCDNRSIWIVALNPGGIATVTSATGSGKSEER